MAVDKTSQPVCTVETLRRDYEAGEMCFCTGSCYVNGIRGYCPLVFQGGSFRSYLEYRLKGALDRSQVFIATGPEHLREALAIQEILAELRDDE